MEMRAAKGLNENEAKGIRNLGFFFFKCEPVENGSRFTGMQSNRRVEPGTRRFDCIPVFNILRTGLGSGSPVGPLGPVQFFHYGNNLCVYIYIYNPHFQQYNYCDLHIKCNQLNKAKIA